MTSMTENAVREYVVRRATFVIETSYADLYHDIRAAALDAVRNDTGNNWSRDDFVMMLDGRGPHDPGEVADVVGLAVREAFGKYLDYSDPRHVMLAELLNLADREQSRLFGEHFMPEADDWPEDVPANLPESGAR